ncbi:MAG: histidinol dehydrogenase [Dehalococcoidia bacterium]|nr:MAG: histidinol dehydrogenase [Dehalococcoidia bacterium]
MRIVDGFKEAKTLLTRWITNGEYQISKTLREKLNQVFGTEEPERAVRQIIDEVRERGDEALYDYTLKIDGIKLSSLEVDRWQVEEALMQVDSRLMAALKLAAEKIYSFHERQHQELQAGVQRIAHNTITRPLERVGIYAPGGIASYPSTVLMTAIPARIAGVNQLFLVTPPRKDGKVPVETLAAASIARIDRIFCIGGAQAIAALAYGTRTIPKVDKICGPGNIFVMLAKKLVFGLVDIDGLQGPSEIVIIADETADPTNCAAEILAQAEHDYLASSILITDSYELARNINREVQKQLVSMKRREIAEESLKKGGIIAVVSDIDKAVELSNMYAPEHLCLDVKNAEVFIDKIINAGCVFLGDEPTAVMGDYVAGPSHALPTGGTARFSSPLNITDFIKYTNIVNVDRASLEELGKTAITIAHAEGLEAHARAVEKRLYKKKSTDE